MRDGPILAVPCAAKGRGGGHLVRSARLVSQLRAAGREAWLFLPSNRLETLQAAPCEWIITTEEALQGRAWQWVVLDYFSAPPEEALRWRALAPLLGIDEGGPARDGFDYLLDLLPGPPGRTPPNRGDPTLLPLPENRKSAPFTFCGGSTPTPPPSECTALSGVDETMPHGVALVIAAVCQKMRDCFSSPSGRPGGLPYGPPVKLRVLVSFGAEDPGGLGIPAVQALLPPPGPAAPIAITLMQGGLCSDKDTAFPPNAPVQVRRNAPNLREELAAFDLVITHFGLTAFEALRAGTAVILAAPTPYHETLARAGGFPSTNPRALRGLVYRRHGTGEINYPALTALAEQCRTLAARYGLDSPETGNLGAALAGMVPCGPRSCPVCEGGSGEPPPALARFPDRTYRRCPRCGMISLFRASPPPVEYATPYFFELYRKQYGKTYLEDFPNLKAAGKRRLQWIGRFLSGPQGGRLLDIGCAYGPFLAAAAEEGYAPLGIEPAEDAARYVREELRLPAVRDFFPPTAPLEEGFAAITLWYVIEHFEDPRKVLEEARRLLRPGGVLAFATPSCAGISARKSPRRFLEKSPGDHWTVWNPRRVRGVLARFGFDVKKIVITGHHPERFPCCGGFKKGAARGIIHTLSRIFGLGDTFEVYAVKV